VRRKRDKATLNSTDGRILLVVILATALGLLWCAGTALATDSTPAPAKPIVFNVGWQDDPDNLNPFIGYNISSYEIFHLNYDFLVGYDPSTLNPRPELAESWESSPDKTVWTFKLRHGVTWQDDEPFTARDVVFTFNYIMDKKLSAFLNYTYNIDSVTALDDYTVEVRCKKPKSNMLRLWVPIVPEHIWSKVDGKAAATSYRNKPPIIGTGPFQVVEVRKARFVRLRANKNYWAGAPKIDEIIFNMYENADTMAMDLKAGTIDVATGVPRAQFTALKSARGITGVAAVFKGNDYIDCNCYDSPDSLGNPVLKDWRFRNALAYAIDREKIVSLAYGGYATPGSSMIAAPLPYHWEPPADQKQVFDLEKAKRLLDAAGYKDTDSNGARNDPTTGKDIVLRLWTDAASESSGTSVRLIASWLDQIGIKTKVGIMDFGVLLDALYNYKGDTYAPDFDLIVWGIGQYVDPDPALSWLTTSQIEFWNDACWSNVEYDRLYREQAVETDSAKRKEIVFKMEEIFYREAAQLELAYPRVLQAYRSDKWEGWVPSPGKDGAVIYTTDNIDTYRLVAPKTTAAETTSSSSTWIVVLVVVLLIVGLAAWRLLRGRNRAIDND
jgi:peptide/nickel transport system substrate-binding protein